MVKHLVSVDGGNPDSVIWVDSGTRELPAEAIVSGEIDATFGSYWPWEIQMDSSIPSDERIVWPVDKIGAPPYHSYLLGTQESKITTDPEEISAFLKATARGYLAVAEQPLLAASIFERTIPYFPASLIERSLPLIAGTWLHNGVWGVQREELIVPYANWLAEHHILQRPENWQAAYTNAFLPQEV